jgi:hypothetical protein
MWAIQVKKYGKCLKKQVSMCKTDSIIVKSYINKIYERTLDLTKMVVATWKLMEKLRMFQVAIIKIQQEIQSSNTLSRLVEEDEDVLEKKAFQLCC